jgi:PTH1 family peptidyl-tRNA hydrolase
MVGEELARAQGERFKKVRFLPAEAAEIREAGERVVLAVSTRFMNESGPSYASLAKKLDVPADRLIAVYDELDIPAGELRVKLGGGSSHNGVKSLQQAMRSREFLHVRIGIGRPPGRQDPADFVLHPIGKQLEAEVAIWVDHAADAVRSLLAEGLTATQDRFNRQSPTG